MSSPDSDSLIFLVGFMGAGKTTVGRLLAQRLDYEFVDLDEVIESNAGKSVREIFLQWGEIEFRRLESEAIKSCCEMKRVVVALGGGAYVSETTRALLRTTGTTFWLDCSLEVCLSRLGADGSRPLLGNEAEMRALLDSRRPAYSQADYVIEADASPEQVASVIIQCLNQISPRS
jgi:shikimate kinase